MQESSKEHTPIKSLFRPLLSFLYGKFVNSPLAQTIQIFLKMPSRSGYLHGED
ncbi:hypothetical protein AC062_2105 [Pasteurellaceae bacterium NI1060]|nr:hypothetical protein AC062_2105 [Pasteurellaceae bacterium NI1060]